MHGGVGIGGRQRVRPGGRHLRRGPAGLGGGRPDRRRTRQPAPRWRSGRPPWRAGVARNLVGPHAGPGASASRAADGRRGADGHDRRVGRRLLGDRGHPPRRRRVRRIDRRASPPRRSPSCRNPENLGTRRPLLAGTHPVDRRIRRARHGHRRAAVPRGERPGAHRGEGAQPEPSTSTRPTSAG